MDGKISSLINSVLLSYSQIFFSENKTLGLILMASTFADPFMGFSGAMGVLFSNLAAYLLGIDKTTINKGLCGFNGLLTGLGMAYFLKFDFSYIFYLIAFSFMLTVIQFFLNILSGYLLGISTMSIPFNIIMLILFFAGTKLGLGNNGNEHYSTFFNNINVFLDWHIPEGIKLFCLTLGKLLFQTELLPCIIIAVAVLCYSRITISLMAVGFLFAFCLHGLLGIDDVLIYQKHLGFNYMLTVLAVGGIFTVPSIGSFYLSIIAVVICMIILVSLAIPAFVLPFNISVILILYLIKNCKMRFLEVKFPPYISSPEKNLEGYKDSLTLLTDHGFKISLPFHGRWIVYQAFEGEMTHKDDFRYAYDFQAVNSEGAIFSGEGSSVEDYFSFGLPVLAPMDGKVVKIENYHDDNPVGGVDTIHNWGNNVIIEHAVGYYSCIAHLKKESVSVFEGQIIKKGEVIGQCGNSGRSPFPHIHIQFQVAPVLGSKTIEFYFSSIALFNSHDAVFTPKAVLKKGEIVQNINYPGDFHSFFPYSYGKVWSYKFNNKPEFWKFEVDFWNNLIIKSFPVVTSVYFELSGGSLLLKKIEGNKKTGLFFFASQLREVLFPVDNLEVNWSFIDLRDYGLNRIARFLNEIFAIIDFNIFRKVNTSITKNGDLFSLKQKSSCFMGFPFAMFRISSVNTTSAQLKRDVGVTLVENSDNKLEFVEFTN